MKKSFKSFTADAASSIVVFLIAIPLCLGIAVASGVSAFSGIIAGIVGGIIVGALSGSQLSVSGPAAGLTAIVAVAVIKLPTPEAFFLAVVLAGLFQIVMGIGKLGVIGDYIPNSVIKGMLAAIGIILIIKQLPYLVGYNSGNNGGASFLKQDGENTFASMFQIANFISLPALMIGLAGLLILLVYEIKWIKKQSFTKIISGPMLVVVIGILMSELFKSHLPGMLSSPIQLVNIPKAETFTEFAGFFQLPNWGFIGNTEVWITAITIALVASLETLLGLEAVDKLDHLKRVSPPNRELLAQGTGNMISGLLGGLPITSVIVRSSANVSAGAKSKKSSIMHGLLILVCVAFVPNVLNMIPISALAAILIFTGYKLAKLPLFKNFFQKGWDQFMPFIVTLLAIVFTNLLQGVLIGIVVGIFYIIRSNFRTAIFVMKDKDLVLVRLRKDVSFFSKPRLKQALEKIEPNSKVLIDMSRAEFIDQDIIETVEEFLMHAPLKNISVNVNRSHYNNSFRIPVLHTAPMEDMAHL